MLDEGVRVRIPPPAPHKQQFEAGLGALLPYGNRVRPDVRRKQRGKDAAYGAELDEVVAIVITSPGQGVCEPVQKKTRTHG